MTKQLLTEYQNPASMSTEISESVDATGNKQKDLYMKGIFIQGDVRNHNQRIYPVTEIQNAVASLTKLIESGVSLFGELDHPSDLKINADRVSHVITSMWMEGVNGCGKMRILPTPMGNIIRAILESGCKLGVSSRGSGNVNESTGYVSDFEIITVDAVCQPSAPNAFPKPVYESLLNWNYGHKTLDLASEINHDVRAQKFLTEQITRFIKELKR